MNFFGVRFVNALQSLQRVEFMITTEHKSPSLPNSIFTMRLHFNLVFKKYSCSFLPASEEQLLCNASQICDGRLV